MKLSSTPKGEKKILGGADRDEWNERLVQSCRVRFACNLADIEESNYASAAALAGMMDMKPADPVEGMLIAQMIVASEAACRCIDGLGSSRRNISLRARSIFSWLIKPQGPLPCWSERLDQHRGRGQQQIVVKHVTVNADQALVTDQVVTSGATAVTTSCRKPLPSAADKPMEAINSAEGVPGGGTKAK